MDELSQIKTVPAPTQKLRKSICEDIQEIPNEKSSNSSGSMSISNKKE